MNFKQLHPTVREIDERELLGGLGLAAKSPPHRPYTIANFIVSTDGRATFHGRSAALGDDGDRAMFHGLREHVEAVLVGTGTLAVERYGRIVPDPVRRSRRVAQGLEPEPLTCVITRSGHIPLSIPLLEEPEARMVVFTGEPLKLGRVAAKVEVVQVDPAFLNNESVLEHLRKQLGIRTLLCEGGPLIFGSLVRDWLLDEMFLTLAPKLAGGGTGPAVTEGPELARPEPLRLVWALERDSSLFLRYALK